MNRARYIILLRDLGLSWKSIAIAVYGRGDGKTRLKVYGIYHTYMRRKRRRKVENVIHSDPVINYVPGPRDYERHISYDIGTMSNREFRRINVYTENARKERHRHELHRLGEALYNIIGINMYDQRRLFLSALHRNIDYLTQFIDLDKATADVKETFVVSASPISWAVVFTAFFMAAWGTKYILYMHDLWETIKKITPRKKQDKILEKIQELFPKALAKIF